MVLILFTTYVHNWNKNLGNSSHHCFWCLCPMVILQKHCKIVTQIESISFLQQIHSWCLSLVPLSRLPKVWQDRNGKQYTKPATNSKVHLLEQISNKELYIFSLNPNLTYLMNIMSEMAAHLSINKDTSLSAWNNCCIKLKCVYLLPKLHMRIHAYMFYNGGQVNTKL